MDQRQLSEHARTRKQQRGIQDAALDLLLQYGRHSHDHRGAIVVYLDHQGRRSAIRDCGRACGPVVDRAANLFAVLSLTGETVITVGHRRRRMIRG
jgi:hypothetical protein